MPQHTTYSFLDLSGAIAHPQVGAYSFTGEGVGEITVSMSTDKTVHDVASDGSVMVSKMAGNNGTVTITCQQTSALQRWLLEWYNYLVHLAPTSEWAQSAMTLRNTSDGSSHTCIGVSPQKKADKPYQSQGQRCSWVMMCADIQSMNG